MGLRNGIIMDAAAEVSPEVLANPLLRVLPVRIQVEDRFLLDQRDPETTRRFTRDMLTKKSAENTRSVPYKFDEMRNFFLNEVARDFDHVFGLFVTKTRSPIFQNAFDASSRIIGESVTIRNEAGLKGPLFIECYDSQNFFAGYGVQIMEMLRTLTINGSQAGIRSRLEFITPRAYTYVAPHDLEFLMTRAKAKGEDSVGALGAMAAKFLGVLPIIQGHRGESAAVAKLRGHPAACDWVLRLTRRELQKGLVAPIVAVSYAGDLEDVRAMPEFRNLEIDAAQANVQISLCEMAPTNSVNLGARALSVGFIAEPHEAVL